MFWKKSTKIVANNIAILRKKNRLSLEELGKLSGVSKSMLALIEKGDGNPTLGILWKIANGLGVPFDELTRRPDPMNHVVKISEIEPIPIADGTARNYSVFSDDKKPPFFCFFTWKWTKTAIGIPNPIYRELLNFLLLQKVL